MSPKDYRKWLEKQSASTIEFKRESLLSFLYRYDSRLEEEYKCPSENSYLNAIALLRVLKEVQDKKSK